MSSVALAVRARRRGTAAAAVLVLLALALTATIRVPAASAQTVGTIAVSRSSVIGGEAIRVTGNIGQSRARPVQLQVRKSERWVTVETARTSRSGRFSFSYKPPVRVGTRTYLRAHAPRARVAGAVRSARNTSSRLVKTVAQSGTFLFPYDIPVGLPVTFNVQVKPVRKGRVVVLQRGSMTDGLAEVARGTTNAEGRVQITSTVVNPGQYDFQALVLAAGGAPTYRLGARGAMAYEPTQNPQLVSDNANTISSSTISGNTGYVAYATEHDATVHLWHRTSGSRWALTTAEDVERDVVEVSNDASAVVVQQNVHQPTNASAFVWSLTGGTQTPVAPSLSNVTVLACSGDAAQFLVSTVDEDGSATLYRWTRATGGLERVTPVGVQATDGDMSDNGRYVVYRVGKTLYRVNLDSHVRKVVATGVISPASSSDTGRYLVWQTASGIVYRDLDTDLRVVAPVAQSQSAFPRIAGLGGRVTYIRQDQAEAKTYLWTPTRSVVLLSRTALTPDGPAALSDTGDWVVFATTKTYDASDLGNQDDDLYVYNRFHVRFPAGIAP